MSRWYEGARRAWAHVWPPLSVAERQAAPARGAQAGGAGGLHRSEEIRQAPVPEDGRGRTSPATALDSDFELLLIVMQAINCLGAGVVLLALGRLIGW